MRKPRFKFPKNPQLNASLEEMREELLSRSFNHAAKDIDNIKAAVKNGEAYELPLTGTRPAKGWKARLADFADAAWYNYVPSIKDITAEQVKDSKGYKAFYAAMYDAGFKIDDLTTQTVTRKGQAVHTIAKIEMRRRELPKYFPGPVTS